MAKVYLGIGSNIRREHHIRSGMEYLGRVFVIRQVSSVYESDAVGFAGEAFYNLVTEIDTDLPVGELQRQLRHIEDVHGRDCAQAGPGPRTLDIDILLYDDRVGCIDGVCLPRAEILTSAFVLWPLAEIAGASLHPQLGKSFRQLWFEFGDDRQSITPVSLSLHLQQIA